MQKRFAITGVGGYIAPRHLKAIKDTDNSLIAACDPSDSVGIIDRYFMDVHFFSEFERFDRHLDKLRRRNEGIDFLTICAPNYLHDAHCRLALRLGADTICEKPLVLNPWNLDALAELEQETGRRVYTVLQLRVHPAIMALRRRVLQHPERRWQVDLTYITSRGRWYLSSWKGDETRSGGLVTNIGIHFFDMLMWVFGRPRENLVHLYEPRRAAGRLELERADVRWYLSIDPADLLERGCGEGQVTYRSIRIDEAELEFSTGFADLHTEVYRQILAGEGYGIADARDSIELVHGIRQAEIDVHDDQRHPLANTRRMTGTK